MPHWLILLLVALGLLGTVGLRLESVYGLPWLMIGVAIIAGVYGLLPGALAAAAAMVVFCSLYWPEIQIRGWMDRVLIPGFLLGLSAYTAATVGASLRRAYGQAKALGRVWRFQSELLERLPLAQTQQETVDLLLRFLSAHGAEYVGLWEPIGSGLRLVAGYPLPDWIPDTGAVGRALKEGRPIHVPDVRAEPGYIPPQGVQAKSELALPIFERGEVALVLNLESVRPFAPEEVEAFVRLAQTVSAYLDQLADRRERRVLSEFARAMAWGRSAAEVAERGLKLLLEALALEAGALWMAKGARMVPLAALGAEEAGLQAVLQAGLPYGEGLVWKVYHESIPIFTGRYAELPEGIGALRALDWRTFVAHPIPLLGSRRSRLVLVLGQRLPRPWRRAEKDLLAAAAQTVGLGLERALEAERHARISGLFQKALLKDPEAVYQEILEEAVDLVPGAEAGSLLVLEGGVYTFRAAVGYPLEGLAQLRFAPEGMLLWYGWGTEEALQNQPRILSAQEAPLAEISHKTAPPEIMDTAGRVREIQANLCLPIAHQGQVVAFLNLDNLHDPLAFGEDSLAVARLLAGPLAVLLHEVHWRKRLEESALTDALTGLPNRRAFDQFLAEELARAERYGHPLALLVLDLVGFKTINDRLGHKAGDLALVRVTQALLGQKRNGDRIFRWGGDEFAALLPHTGKEGARAAALRYAEAIGGLEVDGHRLGVNIGIATYPEDGVDPDELLSRADDRMYRAKAQGIPVLAE